MKIAPKFILLLVLLAVGLCGCADPNTLTDTARNSYTEPAGFWRGLWHGICAPFALLGIMFGMDIGVYEAFNTGNWYNFGFLIGAGTFSRSAKITRTTSRKKE